MTTPSDPLAERGIAGFSEDFKAGRITSEAVTRAYLERIQALDPKLQAFEYVDHDGALAAARAIDALFASGTYLGPLMGVPVALKDIFAITGMPRPRVGSLAPLPDLTGDTDGSFIAALRSAGCVFLGQTKAVEFCLGITGVSTPRGTPWNPCDMKEQRIPGGSSSGSSVAVAGGLCAFAIGSDSGGSVRVPAAFNGIFGLKTTIGHWPVDGAFPLDLKVDTIGLLTRTARDAQLAFHAIESVFHGSLDVVATPPVQVDRLRFGRPTSYFFDGLEPQVEQAVNAAMASLQEKGVRIDPVDVPEAPEREGYFPLTMPAALLATLGPDFIEANRNVIDPVIGKRVAAGVDIPAYKVMQAETRRQASVARVRRRFEGFDAWVSPSAAITPPRLAEFDDPERSLMYALSTTRTSQPGNYLDLCGVSIPLPRGAGELPVGLQLMGAGGSDAQLLAVAVAVEQALAAR